MERVELGHLLLIAEIHTGIQAERLARMNRVVTLAQSALAAPFAGFGGVELFPTFEDKAAIYCARLVTYHPFPDGNKRAAYDVMIEFVERNRRMWTHSAGGLSETATMIERLAGEPPPVSEDDFHCLVRFCHRPPARPP
ncbi:MAG: death on curing protein [Solirubrobacteraceae bacterium]|nr:death on curing protein [Solirubrobacteraceae bacterium]